jgi:hypothetical protein
MHWCCIHDRVLKVIYLIVCALGLAHSRHSRSLQLMKEGTSVLWTECCVVWVLEFVRLFLLLRLWKQSK